jgi:uncharacterized protein YdaU (DUF1376 family)
MKNKKIRYVSLDSIAFTSDVFFLSMTAEEMGVYFSIILYLNQNDGFLPMDKALLGGFCNCQNFENVFEKIKHKFLIKDGKISHKRVLQELKRAKYFSQLQSIKGLKANEIRWKNSPRGDSPGMSRGCHGDATGIPKRSEAKIREVKRKAKRNPPVRRTLSSRLRVLRMISRNGSPRRQQVQYL